MPRAKKITQPEIEIKTYDSEVKPEPQIIVAQMPSVVSGFGVPGNSDIIEIEMAEPKKFDIETKTYYVYKNNEFLEEISEGSEKLDFYLNENKSVLDSWISELKSTINDPNELIYINEGEQNRLYMSFDAYYSQNGLAPKPMKFNNWMDYYKSSYPMMSEEEIVLNVKGNLPYSFSLPNSEENL